MDPITNRATPLPDVPAPRRPILTAVLATVGVLFGVAGVVGLLRFGYRDWLTAFVLSVFAGFGVLALGLAWQTWRQRHALAVIFGVALASIVLFVLAGRLAVSPLYHRVSERWAWDRYCQTSSGSAAERWHAYARTVPESFRRPQPEVDYLLSRVREYAGMRHMLAVLLSDLRVRHGDDPAFDPVRREAHAALEGLPNDS